MNILDLKIAFNQYNYATINDVLITKITDILLTIAQYNIPFDDALNLCQKVFNSLFSYINGYKLNALLLIDAYTKEKASIKLYQKDTKMPLFDLIIVQ